MAGRPMTMTRVEIVQRLISTLTTRRSALPTFSSECGGMGSDQNAAGGVAFGIDVRESCTTAPCSSYRTKSLQLTTYIVMGQRCVCSAVRQRGRISVSSTRTRSFSNSTTWCSGAAMTASNESGQVHAAAVVAMQMKSLSEAQQQGLDEATVIPMIRVVLPFHLRNLARIQGDVQIDLDGGTPPTMGAVLDAVESRFPMLRGTIRDHVTLQRRP